MKTILCYGDSNTFGFNTIDGSRFDRNMRWTSLLQKKLNNEYKVINEGMCDRTGFVINPKGALFSAPTHFPKLISKFDNIDILILWIGTNDLQFPYDITIEEIKTRLKELISLSKEKTNNIIIIPPVKLDNRVLNGYFNILFNKTSITKSQDLNAIYEEIAYENNCLYFDVNIITTPCDIDGLHYDANSHKIIANSLYKFIKENF